MNRSPKEMLDATLANLSFALEIHQSALERVATEYSKAPLASPEERELAHKVDLNMGRIDATVQAIGLLRSEFASLLGDPQ